MAKQERGKLDDTLAAMFSNIEYRSSYLFYAHMIGQCSIKMEDTLQAPAGVAFVIDHYNLYVNKNLFDEYTLVERLAILKHEMLHILNDHVGRREERHNLTWNFATDCAINQTIDINHLPKKCVNPETLGKELGFPVPLNKSSEFYYDMLKEHLEKEAQNKSNDQGEGESKGEGSPQNGQGNPFGSGGPQLLDSHETWEQSTGDEDLKSDMTKKMIEKAQTETIKSKGTVPQEASIWLEFFTRKSELNWKKVLRGIIGNKRVGSRTTIMRTDRRFPKREDLRGKTKDRMFNLLVIADVSGSMDDAAVLSTIGEVRHICDVTKTNVDLIQVDAVAYTPEKLSKKTKLIERKGYGGTILHPALDMAKQHKIDYQAVVVLTDGYLFDDDITYFQKLKKKVIWLIEPNGHMMKEMNEGLMKGFKLKQV